MLDSDTAYKKETVASRVEFSGTDGLGSITENITLSSGKSTVKTYTLFVKVVLLKQNILYRY